MSPKNTSLSDAQGAMAMAGTWTEPRPWQILAFSDAQDVGCGHC